MENPLPIRPSGTIDKSPRQARCVRRRGVTSTILFFVPWGRFIRKRSLRVNFFPSLIAVAYHPFTAAKH